MIIIQYIVEGLFEKIALAISEPYPDLDLVNRYILTVMDYFTGWVEAYAIPNQEASTAADVIIKVFVSRFGESFELHSNQGRNFSATYVIDWVFRSEDL